MIKLNKDQIRDLLPHREPMLLIDELYDIKELSSATAIVNVKKNSFYNFVDNIYLYLSYFLSFCCIYSKGFLLFFVEIFFRGKPIVHPHSS